jgi:hypothetical protein
MKDLKAFINVEDSMVRGTKVKELERRLTH